MSTKGQERNSALGRKVGSLGASEGGISSQSFCPPDAGTLLPGVSPRKALMGKPRITSPPPRRPLGRAATPQPESEGSCAAIGDGPRSDSISPPLSHVRLAFKFAISTTWLGSKFFGKNCSFCPSFWLEGSRETITCLPVEDVRGEGYVLDNAFF